MERASALAAATFAVYAGAATANVQVSLVSSSPISQTNPTYASWNIDSSCNRGFHQTNFTNPNLAAAARALTPSSLRFGGSGNDNLIYGLTEGSPECAGIVPDGCDYVTPGCLNATHWNNLYGFGVAAQVQFMFGLAFGLVEACAIGPSYVWNYTNAQELLKYMVAHDQTVFGFELGNEVNNNGPSTQCRLQPGQQAAAAAQLSSMLAATMPNALIIGPDTGYLDALQWLQGYLPLLNPGTVHAITHHVYNGLQRKNYNSPAQFDSPLPEIAWYTNVTQSLYPSAQVWAGENGPTGGGDDGTCGPNATCGLYATTMWYARWRQWSCTSITLYGPVPFGARASLQERAQGVRAGPGVVPVAGRGVGGPCRPSSSMRRGNLPKSASLACKHHMIGPGNVGAHMAGHGAKTLGGGGPGKIGWRFRLAKPEEMLAHHGKCDILSLDGRSGKQVDIGRQLDASEIVDEAAFKSLTVLAAFNPAL
jgi:hypothetical protein